MKEKMCQVIEDWGRNVRPPPPPPLPPPSPLFFQL
jgi:hypothetical protein